MLWTVGRRALQNIKLTQILLKEGLNSTALGRSVILPVRPFESDFLILNTCRQLTPCYPHTAVGSSSADPGETVFHVYALSAQRHNGCLNLEKMYLMLIGKVKQVEELAGRMLDPSAQAYIQIIWQGTGNITAILDQSLLNFWLSDCQVEVERFWSSVVHKNLVTTPSEHKPCYRHPHLGDKSPLTLEMN